MHDAHNTGEEWEIAHELEGSLARLWLVEVMPLAEQANARRPAKARRMSASSVQTSNDGKGFSPDSWP
jgi:hypothetical protein